MAAPSAIVEARFSTELGSGCPFEAPSQPFFSPHTPPPTSYSLSAQATVLPSPGSLTIANKTFPTLHFPLHTSSPQNKTAKLVALGTIKNSSDPVNATKTLVQALLEDAHSHLAKKSALLYKCVSKEEVVARIQSFADAVPTISQLFWDNGGGPDGTNYPQKACQAAYQAAVDTLAGAYGYDGKVLFKPTLTTGTYTYREFFNGALSYFIGTQCLNLAGKPGDQFPLGNDDGSIFYEYGFALQNYNGGSGFVFPTVWDPDSFLYRIASGGYDENCQSPVAMGKMCFTAKGATAGSGPCVDKTFGFNRRTDGQVVFTTHHSSSIIIEPVPGGSTTVCQDNASAFGLPECT
jgi:hypothetical protein